jgi:hypothetical protein
MKYQPLYVSILAQVQHAIAMFVNTLWVIRQNIMSNNIFIITAKFCGLGPINQHLGGRECFSPSASIIFLGGRECLSLSASIIFKLNKNQINFFLHKKSVKNYFYKFCQNCRVRLFIPLRLKWLFSYNTVCHYLKSFYNRV